MAIKFKIKRNDFLDEIILTSIILNVMIFNWLGITNIINMILFFMMLSSIFLHINQYLISPNINKVLIVITLIALFFVIPLLNYLRMGGTFSVLLTNIKSIVQRMMVLLYLFFLMKYKRDFLENYLVKKFWLFNGFLLLNIPFLVLQYFGVYRTVSLQGSQNTYAPDLMSGLFGNDGVAFLAIYVGFIIVYNINYYKHYIRKNKVAFIVYNVIWSISILLFSFVNDNKGLFFIMPLFLAIYYIVDGQSKYSGRKIFQLFWIFLKRSFKYVVVVLLIFILLYVFAPQVQQLVEDVIRIFKVATNRGYTIGGSNERFRMIWLAWKDKANLLWGHGMANYIWKEEGAFGFYHFGQSDFGTFMLLGGIVLLITLFGSITIILNEIFHNFMVAILIMFAFLVSSIFTLEFTNVSPFTSTVLFVLVCWWDYMRGENRDIWINQKRNA